MLDPIRSPHSSTLAFLGLPPQMIGRPRIFVMHGYPVMKLPAIIRLHTAARSTRGNMFTNIGCRSVRCNTRDPTIAVFTISPPSSSRSSCSRSRNMRPGKMYIYNDWQISLWRVCFTWRCCLFLLSRRKLVSDHIQHLSSRSMFPSHDTRLV
jgi:hypothetical protein